MFDLENGAVFIYRGSWCAPGLGTSWECAWRFVGAKGALTWDGGRSDPHRGRRRGRARRPVRRRRRRSSRRRSRPDDRIGGHFGVLSDFVAAVASGNEPETAGSDNIRSLAMVLGAIESAEAGRRVDIVDLKRGIHERRCSTSASAP